MIFARLQILAISARFASRFRVPRWASHVDNGQVSDRRRRLLRAREPGADHV